MSNYDIEIEMNRLEKGISILNMIKKSNVKITTILFSKYYTVFGNESERKSAIEQQRKVTNRLLNYYAINYEK